MIRKNPFHIDTGFFVFPRTADYKRLARRTFHVIVVIMLVGNQKNVVIKPRSTQADFFGKRVKKQTDAL